MAATTKAEKAAAAEGRFRALLGELFRTEHSDLTFGVYRFMNQKREAVDKFVAEKIVPLVDEALAGGGAAAELTDADVTAAKDALKQQILMNLDKEAFDEDGALKPNWRQTSYGKLWTVLDTLGGKPAPAPDAMRFEVFNRLYDFFSRYFDEGDFVCKQRLAARARYAVPYDGGEVMMHWANRDQYYIKTSEHYSSYAFAMGDDETMRFAVQEAQTERDNNKASDKKLFFPLAEKLARQEDGVYLLPFEHRALLAEERAAKLDQATVVAALGRLPAGAAAPKLGEAKKQKLAEHIEKFIRRNTADFFIHKNLRGFLRGELQYFINSEVLRAEEAARGDELALARFAVAQGIIRSAHVIIDFLAQLEDFQKSLWEKKKFVTESHYCVTVRHLPAAARDELLADIAGCDKQWQEWRDLHCCGDDMAGAKPAARLAFLQDNQTLVADTANFAPEFKDKLLAAFDNLDEATDGVLFHCENWQALNLLQEKYRGRVQCVYIDPPYNTASSPILYKNDYKDASWLSLIENRVSRAHSLIAENGISIVAIDDVELRYLMLLLDSVFGQENYISIIASLCNPQGRVADKVNKITEYHIIHAKNKEAVDKLMVSKIGEVSADGTALKRTGTNSRREERPKRFFPILIKDGKLSMITDEEYDKIYNAETKEFDDSFLAKLKSSYEKNGYAVLLPIGRDGQLFVWQREFSRVKEELSTYMVRDGAIRTPSFDEEIPKTYWVDSKFSNPEYGSEFTKHIIGHGVYENTAKSIYTLQRMCQMNNPELILDYFAGSGTTAHAVINLNRADGGRRKFILAEMGEYFCTVLLPRIKKVVFAPAWKDGKPNGRASADDADNAPRLIKYHRIESYDDALENVAFDSDTQALRMINDYESRYMLRAESRGCAAFAKAGDLAKPFEYTLLRANGGDTLMHADLPETFVYLSGMEEHARRVFLDGKRRYVAQFGRLRGEAAVVVWRDCFGWKQDDVLQDREFIEKTILPAAPGEGRHRVFANGECAARGAVNIADEFVAKMFGGGGDG